MIAALGMHLWSRFRRRMITLRWTTQTQAFALSGADATHGTVEVLYNGEPAENVYVVTIQVTNDSSSDLSGLELQAGLRDGSTFLSASAQVRGSLRVLPLSSDFAEVVSNLAATPVESRSAESLSQITTNRFFAIPVLNRGARVDLGFLVHAPAGVVPAILLNTDHEGVRLHAEPPKPQLLGVRTDQATWIGLVASLVLVFGVGLAGWIPLTSSLGAFPLGTLVLLIGIAVIRGYRLVVRLLS